MAWIEYHTQLRDHWKIQRLADKLQCKYPEALGIVSCLWLWAADNASNGNLSRFTDEELCKASRCDVKIPFSAALKECELLTSKGKIHDWSKHGLKYLISIRNRVKKYRKNVTLQTRNSNASVTATLPNHTLPNHTKEESPLPLKGGNEVIPDCLNTEDFKKTWKEWKQYRQGKGKIKDWALLFTKQLSELSKTPEDAVAILNQSMFQGWTGIFSLKNINKGVDNGQRKSKSDREYPQEIAVAHL
jgi:hypothetical protein